MKDVLLFCISTLTHGYLPIFSLVIFTIVSALQMFVNIPWMAFKTIHQEQMSGGIGTFGNLPAFRPLSHTVVTL